MKQIYKDLKKLEELIGTQALISLRKRATTLNIWRCSSPDNWYIENSRKEMIWHSSDERFRKLPSLGMFDLVEDSKTKIRVSGPGSWIVRKEQGMPEKSTYRLKSEYLLKGSPWMKS